MAKDRGEPRHRLALPSAAGGLAALVLLAALGSACGSSSILKPRGLGALEVERFWWILFGIATGVFAIVFGLIVVAVARRNRPPAPEGEIAWGNTFILWAGVIVPAVILVGTFVLTLHEMSLLAAPGRKADLTISVIGHQWWWEVRYPGGVVTANEIHIPTGETVKVLLTTADVIHSFWVPQLQTKTDMIPGRTNQTWLQTDTPGQYRGECAQFCGLQHANMDFDVTAQPPAQFQAWLADQTAPAPTPTTPEAQAGMAVFMGQDCSGCHAIRGTSASGVVGPDLTHLATRVSIAAGRMPNNAGDLATWITNPQSVKPGTEMPGTSLSPSDLQALVAYLQSLS